MWMCVVAVYYFSALQLVANPSSRRFHLFFRIPLDLSGVSILAPLSGFRKAERQSFRVDQANSQSVSVKQTNQISLC